MILLNKQPTRLRFTSNNLKDYDVILLCYDNGSGWRCIRRSRHTPFYQVQGHFQGGRRRLVLTCLPAQRAGIIDKNMENRHEFLNALKYINSGYEFRFYREKVESDLCVLEIYAEDTKRIKFELREKEVTILLAYKKLVIADMLA